MLNLARGYCQNKQKIFISPRLITPHCECQDLIYSGIVSSATVMIVIYYDNKHTAHHRGMLMYSSLKFLYWSYAKFCVKTSSTCHIHWNKLPMRKFLCSETTSILLNCTTHQLCSHIYRSKQHTGWVFINKKWHSRSNLLTVAAVFMDIHYCWKKSRSYWKTSSWALLTLLKYDHFTELQSCRANHKHL